MENKGKPSKDEPDQRKEIESEQRETDQTPRTTHRTDRSREMEKGGKGPEPDIGGVQRPPADS